MDISEEFNKRREQPAEQNFNEAAADYSNYIRSLPNYDSEKIRQELLEFKLQFPKQPIEYDDLVEFYSRIISYLDRVLYMKNSLVGPRVDACEKAAKDLGVMAMGICAPGAREVDKKAYAEMLVHPYKRLLLDASMVCKIIDGYEEELRQLSMNMVQLLREKQTIYGVNQRYMNQGISVAYDRMGTGSQDDASVRKLIPPKIESFE